MGAAVLLEAVGGKLLTVFGVVTGAVKVDGVEVGGATGMLLVAPAGSPAAGLKALKLVGAGALVVLSARGCSVLWSPTL